MFAGSVCQAAAHPRRRWSASGLLSIVLGCVLVTSVVAGLPASFSAAPRAQLSQAGFAPSPAAPRDDSFLKISRLLYADDFTKGLADWTVELEKPGRIAVGGGTLDIDVPAGATLWFRHKLSGPVLIEYQATAVSAGGPNDRVSDLNCFWMATDPREPADIFKHPRHGAFAEYNTLRTYYVGLGGNGNTTTRFRRYLGDPVERPLLPEHDLSARDDMIQPNHSQTIRLAANGSFVAYYRGQRRIFTLQDPEPYTQGWFAIRTTKNHLRIKKLRIYQLEPAPVPAS